MKATTLMKKVKMKKEVSVKKRQQSRQKTMDLMRAASWSNLRPR